jgi:hypothetical protein
MHDTVSDGTGFTTVFLLRLGLPFPFATHEERQEAFKRMDENGDESVSFDEWLNFSVSEIISKVA